VWNTDKGTQVFVMTGFRRNIFSYYKGSSQKEQDREQQLEDNTTKALINTLENCDRYVVTEFLKWLGIAEPGRTAFVMQKSTIGHERIRRKKDRLLLAIVGASNEKNESICRQLPKKPNGDSRPDAWLYGDGFVILVESKIGNSTLELNQMACHWHKLTPNRWRVLTWPEVHRFFVTLTPSLKDAKSRWLAEQFTQYLEWTGMTEFVGFKEEMFEFFVSPERDLDTKKWVRGTVEALANELLQGKQGLKRFNGFYTDKYVGNLGEKSDHYWVVFGPSVFKDWAHQTVSLGEQELFVFVNVELLPVVRRLRKKIKDGKGLRQVMCSIPAPFTVRISERKTTDIPRKFDRNRIAEIETGMYKGARYGLKDSDSTGFEYLERLLFDIHLPDLTIGRRFSRQQVLELSKPNGEALVAEVCRTQKELHRLVEFING
jgi:hypothetical protein